jgi:hypothetical protein
VALPDQPLGGRPRRGGGPLVAQSAEFSLGGAYEAALLIYRNETDPGFLVLSVYVDVTPEEVAASRLRPTAMT